jgi:hypothetical protein
VPPNKGKKTKKKLEWGNTFNLKQAAEKRHYLLPISEIEKNNAIEQGPRSPSSNRQALL